MRDRSHRAPTEASWHSPATGVEMPLRRYGHRGAPLVYLPSSGGDHTEFERYGMPGICRPWIDAGRLQVVAIDARGPHGLWNDVMPPAERMRAYASVERYAVEELLPWIARETGRERVTVVGVSYGAFLAANLLFKHAARIERVCGLGGVYGLWHRLDGHRSDDVYFHTPLEYLPNLDDPALLGAIRATRGIDLYAAADDEWLDSSLRLRHVLRVKRLPHTIDVWPAPASHHERWWRPQLGAFLQRRF